MTDNVYEFGSDNAEDAEVNYDYKISYTTVDGEAREKLINGYLVVNSLLVAVCRGKGIIHFLVPFERIRELEIVGEDN